MVNMLNKWLEFCERIGAKGNIRNFYREIEGLYSIPKRYYHTLEGHIARCLNEFEPAEHLAEHPDEVRMALWLHDLFNDPRKKNNEKKSAEYAQLLAFRMGLPDDFGRRVYSLILPTEHNLQVHGVDAKLVVDVDLSIFGTSPNEYDVYERNVTREYEGVYTEKEFKIGRLGVLAEFLSRKPIYLTDFFRAKYEEQAKRNFEQSIARLTQA